MQIALLCQYIRFILEEKRIRKIIFTSNLYCSGLIFDAIVTKTTMMHTRVKLSFHQERLVYYNNCRNENMFN